jgi:hypothetical protein
VNPTHIIDHQAVFPPVHSQFSLEGFIDNHYLKLWNKNNIVNCLTNKNGDVYHLAVGVRNERECSSLSHEPLKEKQFWQKPNNEQLSTNNQQPKQYHRAPTVFARTCTA